MKDYEIAIEWLLDCGLIKKVYKIKEPHVPLKAYVDFNSFVKGTLDNLRLLEPQDPDAYLVVVPYYNKTPQEGLYQHFKAIADSTVLTGGCAKKFTKEELLKVLLECR